MNGSNGANAVIGAIAAPRRREILRLVWQAERSAGELHRALGDVTFGAVSQHLRVLQEAGLVRMRADGRRRLYLADREPLGPLRRWLEEMWDDALYRLKLRAELEEARRGPKRRSARRRPRDDLPFSLERTVLVRARRQTVFRFFTDSERFASWWGAGSSIDPRPGGRVVIRYPGGAIASGEVVEIEPDERIVFTYGYEDPNKPIAPGGSRVTVTFVDRPAGTEVRLRHDVADAETREAHVPGWRFQLSLFANIAARAAVDDPTAIVDSWFSAWDEHDPVARRAILDRICDPAITFHDSFACIAGIDDLDAHITASHLHMPGTIRRDGDPTSCQGTMLAAWIVTGPDGTTLSAGRNVYDLDPDGKIVRVVGFWKS